MDCSPSIHLAFDTLPNTVSHNTMHCGEQSESGLMHTERLFLFISVRCGYIWQSACLASDHIRACLYSRRVQRQHLLQCLHVNMK